MALSTAHISGLFLQGKINTADKQRQLARTQLGLFFLINLTVYDISTKVITSQ